MATNTDGREEIKPVAPTEQTKWRDPSLVGKYMVDPKTGLAGLFRSPDNGETWVLTDTVYGHVYNQDEVDNIWDNGAGHKVADEIKSATADLPNVRKQADEAVKFAESAIAASKVNSDAIVAQSSAVVEAKSAMDSATAEIQQLKANAANNQMKLSIRDDGVHVRRSLFFENSGGTGAFGGFTRADNSNIVEFSSGDNNGENFRIDCGARFMQYVYINGNARAQQWLTNSTLSKKTNIRKLDQQIALDKIRQDDQYLYEYKRNIEQGIYDPQASFIIDDVNDVSHYSVPREFIDQSGNYREPNVELAYLIAAFQAIDKQVQKQKEEIKELKEKLQHE